ncbi:APC family permease [Patescibacteria group bacterium]
MNSPTLKRDLGLFHATAVGVGIILGAGIYVLLGAAAGIAGNSVWVSFFLAALVALLTGLSYAELSSIYPTDAAEYDYTEKAFKKKGLAFFVAYQVILSAIISSATVAMGFAGYFSALFGMNHMIIISILVIVVFSIINFRSIKGSALTNVVCAALEVIGLFVIIFLAIPHIGSVSYTEMPQGFDGVLKASALVFFAFLGFESIVKLSEEVKDPTKNIPRALLLSLLITTVLYILVAIAAVSILDWEALGASKAPLADVAATVLGNNAFIVLSVIALFSTANTVLISLIAGSRALYGIGSGYRLLKPFTKVHPKTRTPHYAIFAVMIFAILFSLIEDIGFIAELTNFTLFVTFAIINLAVIVLRYNAPNEKRPFKIPLNIGKFPILALLGILSCLFFITQLTTTIILGGVALSVVGFVIYGVLRLGEKRD